MSANYLPIAVKNIGVTLEDMLPLLPREPPDQNVYLNLCRLFRYLGTGKLLLSSDPAPFFANLFKSSRAYLAFLEQAPTSERVASRGAEPFFDAVACRDEEGARTMARQTPSTPNLKREYEEELFYLRALMGLYAGEPGEQEIGDSLAKWRALDTRRADLRLPLCRAMLARDQRVFDQALQDAIDERVRKLKELQEEERLGPDEAPIAPYVSTEVLAWLEIASCRGLSIPSDAPLAPAVARVFERATYPAPDAWRVPERYRQLPLSPE